LTETKRKEQNRQNMSERKKGEEWGRKEEHNRSQNVMERESE
jgi:hypothetical protein